MLRGVSKQIIEINETENNLFEKVIFYVRPENSGVEKSKLEQKAKDYISKISHEKLPQGKEVINGKLPLIGTLILGAVLVGGTIAMILYLF